MDHSTLGQYTVAMAPLIPKVVSFMLTFAMICIHWVNYHYFFSHIRRTTIELVWLNNLFLSWICFLPFPTSILGDHPTDQFPILLYAVNSLLAALTFYAFQSYTSRAKLIEEEIQKLWAGTQSSCHHTLWVIDSVGICKCLFILGLFSRRSVAVFCANYDSRSQQEVE